MNPRLVIDDEGVGRIVFDDPERPHNILTREVLETLDQVVGEAEGAARNGALRALVVLSARPASFIAGADVNAIAAIEDRGAAIQAARDGQALYGRIAALPVPTLAAVRGICLGGGTELALSCDYRVADDGGHTRIGLPEVQLGLLPGWGGTTRLPGLLGLSAALKVMLSGKPLRASRARRVGLVDRVLPTQQFEQRSLALARALARGESGSLGGAGRSRRGRGPAPGPRGRRTLGSRLLDGTPPGRALVLRTARRQVLKRTGGHYPAPLKILEVVRKGWGRSVAERLELEARAVGELAVSSECKNLLFLFQLREAARKGPWAPSGRAADVGKLAVIGAGPMGGGIAQVAAYNNIRVRMKDIHHEAVAGGLAHARSIFDAAVGRRSLRRREAARRMRLISGGVDYAGVGRAEVVVEAVVERLPVKEAVLRDVEAVVAPDAVIASNTSSLSIDSMAAVLERPGRFAGMHFFNPVHRMPLVEVVRGAKTSDDAVETLAALAVRLGKVPVITRDAPGFLVNRILGPCLNEAGHLLDEGWDGHAVDRAWKRFGMPMGPYRLIDEVGIDVVGHAGQTMTEAFGDRMAPAPALVALAGTERLGRKSGRGFYRYAKGREKSFDPSVYAEMQLSTARSRPDPAHVLDRLVLVMINEAARVLEERVVRSAADVDLGMVMGTGFAPFRGGLLKYADDRGVADVAASLAALSRTCGDRYAPVPLVEELARIGGTFHGTFPAAKSAARP